LETLVGQALEYQARGQVSEAIASYEQVLQGGGQRTEVDYNLGLLYQQAGRYADSTAQLGRTAQVPAYAVGSHYALGQCYRSQGYHDSAMEHFLRAAAAVDLETVERGQADDVIALYKSLAEGYHMRGQSERALSLVTSLAGVLSKKGWEDKLPSVNAEIDALSTGEGEAVPSPPSVMPEWQEASRKIAACDAYLKQEHYLAAIEECHDVVSLAPSYLPIHYRLAMIYGRQGRPDHAVDKYLTLASLHLVRQEPAQAAEACHLAMQVAPKAPAPHARLAQVYLKTDQKDKALEELDILGDLELEHGNKEAAIAAIRQIIALSPAGVEGYQRLLAQLEIRR
jgi:tetratricopeptide (TPR) repeat protein